MKLHYNSGCICAFALAAATSTALATPTITTLATFNGANGSYPVAGLLADAAGNLYGTTYNGGASNLGTVFELPVGTQVINTLITFNGTNGANPQASLITDAIGNLYGTTSDIDAGSYGTVFKISAGTHVLSTLATFNGSNGSAPMAGLIMDASGNMYGTTAGGGARNFGTVFQLSAATNSLSTLASFISITNGNSPLAGLLADAAGNMYGTTSGGGGVGLHGTVFKISTGNHSLSTLATFNVDNGASPVASLIADASGNLYGTTRDGGANGLGLGTVFELSAGSNTLTTLATFNGTNGANPFAELIADAAGNLYGTTYIGGPGDIGTIFEISAGTHTLSTLAVFNGANGANPEAGLIADASGNLYGTTYNGLGSHFGTIFKLTDSGFVTSIPEPRALSLIALSSLALVRRRRDVQGRLTFQAVCQ